jgi:hypothetical protein
MFYEDENWVPWSQAKVQMRAFVSTVINLRTE